MDFRILTFWIATLCFPCLALGEEDLEFCKPIVFKHDTEACTDGNKYPLIANCTAYYKCDAVQSGAFLREANTVCTQGQFFDHKTLECVAGTPEQIENCDQKKCESFYHGQGMGNLDQGPGGRYNNQGPPYPPQNQPGYPPQNPSGYPPQNPSGYPPQNPSGYPPQNPSGYPPQNPSGYQPQHNTTYQNSPHDGQPQGPGSGHGAHGSNQDYENPAGGQAQAGKGKPDSGKKGDNSGHTHNGSSIQSVTTSALIVAIFFTSVQNMF